MDDIKIIDLFFARSELAIEALDGKYGAICHNLSRSILKDQQDAEECVNDAYQSLIAQQDLIISHIYATGQTVIPPNE